MQARSPSGIRRPRTAAAGGRPQAGLEEVEKLLTTKLTSTDATVRSAGMLRVPHRRTLIELATASDYACYWSWWPRCQHRLPRAATQQASTKPRSDRSGCDPTSDRRLQPGAEGARQGGKVIGVDHLDQA